MFNKKYLVWLDCSNCNTRSLNKIPKGNTIVNWINSKNAKCDYCGCTITNSTYFEVYREYNKEKEE